MTTSIDIRSYGGEVERHNHGFPQIVLPRDGSMTIEIDGRAGRVTRGRGAFIAAGAAHAFHADGRNAFVVIDHAGVDEIALRADHPRHDPFFALTQAAEALLDYGEATEPTVLTSDLRGCWTRLLLHALPVVRAAGTNQGDLALQRAEAFMRRHLGKSISVTDIARAAGVSATRLHGLFRERRHSSPHATLGRLRIEAARDMLIGTCRPIADIALATGHADQSALNRRFQGAGLLSPGAVRRHARAVQDLPKHRPD